jgi:mono/diheme cytochrome c family protein
MSKTILVSTGLVLALGAVAYATVVAKPHAAPRGDVARGAYIVGSFGCTDCHTPWKMGPNGPEPDTTLHLSGHPESLVMPPAPELPPGPWLVTVGATNTAWAGPWGTSFTANLTPDPETGIGRWTVQEFIDTLRSGRHLGRGRELLPPMPWPVIRNLTDDDLASVFAYLQSIPPIQNRVPNPLPPKGS